MGLIRPELLTALREGREAVAAVGLAAFGGWLVWLGGLVLMPLGVAVLALSAVWLVQALRRVRFRQAVDAPGLVEVDEGQVGYMGPTFGGFVSLPDLVEIRLITVGGRKAWRLKQADGQALLVPVSATGADRLFDAFASLPGMDMQALVAALEAGGAAPAGGRALALPDEGARIGAVVWRRPGIAALR